MRLTRRLPYKQCKVNLSGARPPAEVAAEARTAIYGCNASATRTSATKKRNFKPWESTVYLCVSIKGCRVVCKHRDVHTPPPVTDEQYGAPAAAAGPVNGEKKLTALVKFVTGASTKVM